MKVRSWRLDLLLFGIAAALFIFAGVLAYREWYLNLDRVVAREVRCVVLLIPEKVGTENSRAFVLTNSGTILEATAEYSGGNYSIQPRRLNEVVDVWSTSANTANASVRALISNHYLLDFGIC